MLQGFINFVTNNTDILNGNQVCNSFSSTKIQCAKMHDKKNLQKHLNVCIPEKNWTISSLLQPKGSPLNFSMQPLQLSGGGPLRRITHSISLFLDLNTVLNTRKYEHNTRYVRKTILSKT